MSSQADIKPGETWRERAGSAVLDPRDPHGQPISTPPDRRWLWRIEDLLTVSAANDAQQQLAADLHAYLTETCEHHWLHICDNKGFVPYDQCLWCRDVTVPGDGTSALTAKETKR